MIPTSMAGVFVVSLPVPFVMSTFWPLSRSTRVARLHLVYLSFVVAILGRQLLTIRPDRVPEVIRRDGQDNGAVSEVDDEGEVCCMIKSPPVADCDILLDLQMVFIVWGFGPVGDHPFDAISYAVHGGPPILCLSYGLLSPSFANRCWYCCESRPRQ